MFDALTQSTVDTYGKTSDTDITVVYSCYK